ncbi:OLC1v1021839C1 [Oldenlandia corymbosa var. corymbosa]|uniref:Non-specific lipid-transfer protein n=1 Tax=Oldenlandia corymbosa var. corymbosa TaxID=529605 RepID=A0AAV1BX71_OLDCO|nr:OLC1v1021839C1 [Oldenlandia corymbosa var. corymbosa]
MTKLNGIVSMGVLWVLVVIGVTVLMMPNAAVAITCDDVNRYLLPCFGYLTSQDNNAKPDRVCCKGVANLNNAAGTPANRQTACRCMQQLQRQYSRYVNPYNAKELPHRCDVYVPYEISTSTNCDNVR